MPLASRITVSFVDVQPSVIRMLKLDATPARRTRWSTAGSAAASVVSTASIVAMFGASMAAPLAMPPTTKPGRCTTTSLATVSVVMMARAASWPPSGVRPAARAGMPPSTTSIGQRDADEAGGADEHLVGGAPEGGGGGGAHALGVLHPGGAGGGVGVAAVEDHGGGPAAAGDEVACGVTTTGAAVSLFCVKVAAASTASPSAVATRDRSGSPDGLMPAAIPAATNPAGVGDAHGPSFRRRRSLQPTAEHRRP